MAGLRTVPRYFGEGLSMMWFAHPSCALRIIGVPVVGSPSFWDRFCIIFVCVRHRFWHSFIIFVDLFADIFVDEFADVFFDMFTDIFVVMFVHMFASTVVTRSPICSRHIRRHIR